MDATNHIGIAWIGYEKSMVDWNFIISASMYVIYIIFVGVMVL